MEIASVRVHFVFDFYISDTSHSAAVDRLLAQSRSCSSEERKGLRNDPHNCSTQHSLSWSARANHVKHSIDVTRSPHQTFIRILASHPHDLRKYNPEQAQAFKVNLELMKQVGTCLQLCYHVFLSLSLMIVSCLIHCHTTIAKPQIISDDL